MITFLFYYLIIFDYFLPCGFGNAGICEVMELVEGVGGEVGGEGGEEGVARAAPPHAHESGRGSARSRGSSTGVIASVDFHVDFHLRKKIELLNYGERKKNKR